MFKYSFDLECEYAGLLAEDEAFLNIETTGLSYRNSFIYMLQIARAVPADEQGSEQKILRSVCYLAESRRDEKELLYELRRECGGLSAVISYSGRSFSLPFIKERFSLYSDEEFFDEGLRHIDILDEIRPYRKLPGLGSLKKYDIERFAGYRRTGNESGKELCDIFQLWEKGGHAGARGLLTGHGREDILSLAYLNRMRAYPLFMKGESFEEIDTEFSEGQCRINIFLNRAFPQPISYKNSFAGISLKDNTAELMIETKKARMKHFLSGQVSDYYYLPAEDTAVHRSLARFVAKEHRVKATARTAYTCMDGVFLPSPNIKELKLFRESYEDENCFFLIGQSEKPEGPLKQEELRLYLLAVIGLY